MTADPSAAELRAGLVERLTGSGVLSDPAWRSAVEAVPREAFLGDAVFRQDSRLRWEAVHRTETGRREWLTLAYGDRTLVTQIDGVDASHADRPVHGTPTSSATLPSLVVRMLELAGLRDGDRVLEIGTGSGYSTALLCHRLGQRNVTSVEYDPAVAGAAADHLAAAGYAPTLVTGDGLQGWPEGADYDAIIATCSVRYVPRSWMWQLRDHGTITTALSGWMLASGLIRLRLDDDGGARGRFAGDRVSYMLARPHERPPHPRFQARPGTVRTTRSDPALLRDWTGHFVAQLAAPSCEMMTTDDAVSLWDTATGSQAWTEPAPGGCVVHQYGPVRLWDRIEEGLAVWQQAGSPPQTAFGMTVTDDLSQHVWLGTPQGPAWPLPA